MKKKILFYINTLEHGGAERVLSNLANQFLMEKSDVVFVTSYSVENEYVLSKEIKRVNLEKSKDLHDSVFYRNISRTQKLYKIVKKEKPTLIISFLPESNFRAIIVAKLSKTPIIISVRNDPTQEYKSKFYYYGQKILYPFADGIVFQTEDAKKWFPYKIQNKSEIIMNQVASTFFKVNNISEDYYVSVGRLTEQKNYELLIRAFTKFVQKTSPQKLFIYGEGELKQKLQNLINENKMDDYIILKGISENIPLVLSKAKAFIMCSKYEGMPNALLEAMAAGVVVVSTDCPCGGPKMLINNKKNGMLVNNDDEEELFNALVYIEQNKSEREEMRKNAKLFAARFRPECVFRQWMKYADEVIKKT